MKKLKVILMAAGICTSISGCGSASKSSDMAAENLSMGQAENSIVTIMHEETTWTEDAVWEEIRYLEENFGRDLEFETMDSQVSASYGEELGEYYEFIGRSTEDGYGYVLGFLKGKDDPFESMDQYWRDSDFVVVDRDESTSEEKTIFSLSNIINIHQGAENQILYLQPKDMEEPEELQMAFVYNYCNGEDGQLYLQDVIDRGVRLAVPDSGAYLAVYRYENGQQRVEYVCLTKEEENAILGSDALILPEWYGMYGLQFFVSQETYEETDMEQGPITSEALKIAEDRCRYVAMGIFEIRDLVKADFRMNVGDENGEQLKVAVEITDETVLKELEEIFAAAEAGHEGKCPYTGILTLTRADGKEMVLSLATDSCDGFILGSNGIYTVGKENMERFWEMLWAAEDEYAAK